MSNHPPPLDQRPKKGILKHKGSDCEEEEEEEPKNFQWDEMNILKTYHPADKDYGHMRIDEAPTPYESTIAPVNENEEEEGAGSQQQEQQQQQRRASFSDDLVSAVADKLADADAAPPAAMARREPIDPHDAEAEDELNEEERERRRQFKLKRRQHYNEFQAVLEARARAQEMDEDED